MNHYHYFYVTITMLLFTISISITQEKNAFYMVNFESDVFSIIKLNLKNKKSYYINHVQLN